MGRKMRHRRTPCRTKERVLDSVVADERAAVASLRCGGAAREAALTRTVRQTCPWSDRVPRTHRAGPLVSGTSACSVAAGSKIEHVFVHTSI